VIIKRAHQKSASNEFMMLVTNANEVLAPDGIHGRIADIGVGFGTGRHTA